LRACLFGFPRDRYPARPLARWLLLNNGRSTHPKRTPLLLLCIHLTVFTESLPSDEYMRHINYEIIIGFDTESKIYLFDREWKKEVILVIHEMKLMLAFIIMKYVDVSFM
jgi:hypothetical protein